jgi:hypothetical protein
LTSAGRRNAGGAVTDLLTRAFLIVLTACWVVADATVAGIDHDRVVDITSTCVCGSVGTGIDHWAGISRSWRTSIGHDT